MIINYFSWCWKTNHKVKINFRLVLEVSIFVLWWYWRSFNIQLIVQRRSWFEIDADINIYFYSMELLNVGNIFILILTSIKCWYKTFLCHNHAMYSPDNMISGIPPYRHGFYCYVKMFKLGYTYLAIQTWYIRHS